MIEFWQNRITVNSSSERNQSPWKIMPQKKRNCPNYTQWKFISKPRTFFSFASCIVSQKNPWRAETELTTGQKALCKTNSVNRMLRALMPIPNRDWNGSAITIRTSSFANCTKSCGKKKPTVVIPVLYTAYLFVLDSGRKSNPQRKSPSKQVSTTHQLLSL